MVLMFRQWRDNIRKAFILQKYTNVCFCNMSFLSIYVCVSFNRCFVLALPRIVAALLENNQTPEGIRIPKALVPYCGFEMID